MLCVVVCAARAPYDLLFQAEAQQHQAVCPTVLPWTTVSSFRRGLVVEFSQGVVDSEVSPLNVSGTSAAVLSLARDQDVPCDEVLGIIAEIAETR